MSSCVLMLFPSPEVKRVLIENGLDVVQELRSRGYEFKISTLEGSRSSSRSKDLGVALIGSAAVIASMTPLVLELVRTFTNRGVLVETWESRVLRDASGRPFLDSMGQAIQEESFSPTLLELARKETKLEISGFGISIKFESK